VLALVAAGGCVSRPRPGLAVRALQSDIVFGFRPPAPVAIPPTADITPEASVETAPPVPEQPTTGVFEGHPVPTVPSPKQTLCPAAAEDAFPAQAATFDVSAPPQSGRYRWKETVEQPLGNGKTITTLSFFNHDIIHVSPVTVSPNPASGLPGAVVGTPTNPVRTFTYDDEIHNPDGSTTTTTYQVKQNQVQINQTLQVGTNIQAGPPDRGVAIVKVVTASADGKVLSTFAPTSPVLLLPLDVVAPGSFNSTGVAPDGSTLSVNGQVTKRARVDACGTIIDGWEVVSQQVFTPSDPSQEASTVNDTYYVGTQIGGLLTYESKSLPAQLQTASSPTVIDSIGQLHPDPIPTGK
jgi:hypothetical protein